VNETPETLAQRITWVRQAAGERFTALELTIHIADLVVTEDREQVAHFFATSSLTVSQPRIKAFAPVMARLL
jgi:hypothetical protein